MSATIAKCKAAKVPVGIAVQGAAEDYAAWVKRGSNFTILGDDYDWITQAAGAILRRAREITGGW